MDEQTSNTAAEYVGRAAEIVDAALGLSVQMAKAHGLPMSDVWPIAEALLEHGAEMAAAEIQGELVEAATKATQDPLLGRFLSGTH